MTVVELKDIHDYFGHGLEELTSKFSKNVVGTLWVFETKTLAKYSMPALDYLVEAHQVEGEPMQVLAKAVGIDPNTLKEMFDYLDLPTLNRKEATKRRRDEERAANIYYPASREQRT